MQPRNEPLSSKQTLFLDQFMADSGSVGDWLKIIPVEEDQGPILIFPSRSVYSPTHLISAVTKAWRSVFRKENRAKDASIEVLRWLSGSRQVSTALDIMRIDPPETVMFARLPAEFGKTDPEGMELSISRELIEFSTDIGLERINGELLWAGPDIRSIYPHLSEDEEEILEWSVLEMVALTEL